ncbi:MAG TPA: palindromic element RPE4 domain-containing protein [Rickettsia endosymbiont of Columbicola hoogstraali]|nr:palindromic element RPE4 domain-containing protein [Rickettsia endosymbiont of Columbicola hoogstraali]
MQKNNKKYRYKKLDLSRFMLDPVAGPRDDIKHVCTMMNHKPSQSANKPLPALP